MVADLEVRGAALVRHPAIRLLTGPLSDASSSGPEFSGQAPVVLDADGEQQAVVDAVLAGGRVAVRAPAGSGATQAIADAVAGLAASGRRSLLVAPYAEELADVRRRLAELGLADLVLDLGADPFERALVALATAGRRRCRAPRAVPTTSPSRVRDPDQRSHRRMPELDPLKAAELAEGRGPGAGRPVWPVTSRPCTIATSRGASRRTPRRSRSPSSTAMRPHRARGCG